MKPKNLCALLAGTLFLFPQITEGELIISEFAALGTELEDADGDTPDWIEIHNTGAAEVALGGWTLTDKADQADLWTFPPVTLPASGYLVVFASGKDRAIAGSELHTNFSLTSSGEYLALVKPGGVSKGSEFAPSFPEQESGTTYGILADGRYVYFEGGTPGLDNAGVSFDGFVADTKFATGRGFFSTAFDETITCATPGATIVYTTDGSVPTLENGTQVAAPDAGSLPVAAVPISRTSALRAAAFKEGLRPTNIDTNTYIFPGDVASQSASVTQDVYGLPARWGATNPDYGMDTDVVGPNDRFDGVYAASIESDLQSVPSVSLVLPVDDMFGRRGIYSNPTNEGIRWETATSAEYIRPDGAEGFQIDCGVRIQGRASRSNGLSLKNSFRLAFRAQYGPGKLNYNLYGDGATDEFDTLILRMHFNDGWSWGGAGRTPQYLREEYGHRMQLASGHPSPHGQLVHLYINGVYWGLYNLRERPDSRFAASYFGINEEDWDGLNTGTPINSSDDPARAARTNAAWDALVERCQRVEDGATVAERHAAYMDVMGANPDGSDNPSRESFLDVDNYIDYLLLNFHMANADWPGRNFYCGRENAPDSEGFRFFVWDPEISMHCSQGASDQRLTSVRQDHINSLSTASNNRRDVVTVPFHRLRSSEAFRQRFADRAHRVLAKGGIFYVDPDNGVWDPAQPERNRPAALYSELADMVESPLVGESARWGDQHRSIPYTVQREWAEERDHMLQEWLPERSEYFMGHLMRAGLYPDTEAPQFNEDGGAVPPGFRLVMSAGQDDSETGTLYYTTDGTDPLLINADGTFSVAPSASVYQRGGPGIDLASSSTVGARVLNGAEWSALNRAEFIIGETPSTSSLVISEFSYRPATPSAEEIAAGYNDRDDFEFIELMNVGNVPLDLSDVVFDDGITFDIGTIANPADRTLAPGERVVIVENIDAFRFRYGTSARVLGQYQGALSNDGETLALNLKSGTALQGLTYNDQEPWPTCADGGGFSLTLADPGSAPDHNDPASWECSALPGGTPGFGGARVAPDTYVIGQVAIGNATFSTLAYRVAADAAAGYQLEYSTDLVDWRNESDGVIVLHSEAPNGDGTSTVTWRSVAPVNEQTKGFWRFFQ